MLPSKEHTYILQIVNTYYHGYVTSQCDTTHIAEPTEGRYCQLTHDISNQRLCHL